jgi:mono/diheme cytochrome c family protein
MKSPSRRKGSKMHTGFLVATGFMLFGTLATGAAAQENAHAGNAQAGREFARYNCDACHIVATNQDLRPLIGGYAPSFMSIANKPDTTEASLRAFLSHTHAYTNMPYPDLAAPDLANVVAYIRSLRGKQ